MVHKCRIEGIVHALNAVECRAVVVLCLTLIVAQPGHACIISANVQMHWCVHLVERAVIVSSIGFTPAASRLFQAVID